jgi:hypothetical protein
VWQRGGNLAAGRWRDSIDWDLLPISLSTIELLQELTLNHQWHEDQTLPKTWTTEVTEYFEEVKKHYIASE